MKDHKSAVYRQKLTGIGWIGAIAFVAGPIGTFLAITQAGFRGPDPSLIAICAAVSLLAPVLILIGREYYPYSPEPHEAFRDKEDTQSNLPPGVFYPGQPVQKDR